MKSVIRKASATFGLCAAVLASPFALGLACGDTITRSVTLTEDLTDCPDIGLRVWQRNGVVIDLNGHTISGAKGSSAGIMIFESKGSKVIGGTITGFSSGVAVNYSRLIDVENVRFDGVAEGVYFLAVTQSAITHNRFNDNFTGIAMVAEGVDSDNEVLYNTFERNTSAVFLRQSNGNRVSHNTFRENIAGIGLTSSSGNEVVGNGVYDNANGISIAQQGPTAPGSNANVIEGNKLYGNTLGVVLFAAAGSANWNKYNRVSRNAFRGGTTGLDIGGSRNYMTTAAGNSFVGMSDRAVDDRGTRTTLSDNRCSDGTC